MEKSGVFMQVTGHLFSLDFDEAANRGAGAADLYRREHQAEREAARRTTATRLCARGTGS